MKHRNCATEHARSARLRRLAEALRSARRPHTQSQLAEATGYPQSTISMWENGRTIPSTEQVHRIEEVLSLPHGHILSAAGYVDLDTRALPGRAIASRAHVAWRPSTTSLEDFPEQALAWLDEFRPLIDSICVLRDSAYDDTALCALLTSSPVAQLRLGWEFWEASRIEPTEDALDGLAAVIGRTAFGACSYALWGIEMARPIPAGAHAFNNDAHQIIAQSTFRASELARKA